MIKRDFYVNTRREINVGTGISGNFPITFIKDNLLEEMDSNLKLKSRREREGGKEGGRERIMQSIGLKLDTYALRIWD